MSSANSKSLPAEIGMMSVEPGRSFRFAPEWPCSDATVMLDRNSGDFWVVSSLGALALRLLQDHGSLAWPELERRLATLQPDPDSSATLAATVKSLADNGLILLAEQLMPAKTLVDGSTR